MSDTLTAPGTGLQLLPTVNVSITECPAGGFVVIVDGQIHSAHSEGWDANEALARVMAVKFNKTFSRPEHASDVTPRDADGARIFAQRLRPVPSPAAMPPDPAAAPVRSTVVLVLVACALVGSLFGVRLG